MAASGDKSPRRLKPALQGLAPASITIGGPQAHVDRRGRPPNTHMVKSSYPAMKTTQSERMSRPLAEVDPDIYQAILHEADRQHSQLELIGSENFVS